MFLFGEKKAETLIYESLLNEKLSSFLMKNYETGVPETDAVLFVKLCEFFMCNRAIYEAVTAIELEKEKKYNESDGGFGYVIDQIEAKALQMVVSASDTVKLELSHYNINFTVH
jgi:hypothetical protein